jgi:hypothetical protein
MKRHEDVDMVSAFLGCYVKAVEGYFSNTKWSLLKYTYLQQVFVENWEAVEYALGQGCPVHVVSRYIGRCIRVFKIKLEKQHPNSILGLLTDPESTVNRQHRGSFDFCY